MCIIFDVIRNELITFCRVGTLNMGIGSSSDKVDESHRRWEVVIAQNGNEGTGVVESFPLPAVDWHGQQPEQISGASFLSSGWPWTVSEILKNEESRHWEAFIASQESILLCSETATSDGLKSGTKLQGYISNAKVAIIVEMKLSI